MWYTEFTFGTLNADVAIKIIFKKIILHLKIVMSTYKLIKKLNKKINLSKTKTKNSKTEIILGSLK